LIEAVVLLKYEGMTRLGEWFAARLVEIVPRAPDELRADVVVPSRCTGTVRANTDTISRN
jgi:hypothetical protein